MTKKQESLIPSIFCWAKMGAEAGQTLDEILKRKELERRAGNGIFSWGIGNSLGNSYSLARREISSIDILFTPMKSPAKSIDASPEKLAIWLSYFEDKGLPKYLPEHMLVTSRAKHPSGTYKQSHYAIICKSNEDISSNEYSGFMDASLARNYSSLNSVGASQVTAIIKYQQDQYDAPTNPYKISFRAKIHDAGFVKLGTPVLIDGELETLLFDVCTSKNKSQWLYLLKKLKFLALKKASQFGKPEFARYRCLDLENLHNF